MTGQKPSIKDVHVLYQGWGRYLKVGVTLPDGTEVAREVEDHKDAAAVLAFDPESRTALLVRQLRTPMLLASGEGESLEVMPGCWTATSPPIALGAKPGRRPGSRSLASFP